MDEVLKGFVSGVFDLCDVLQLVIDRLNDSLLLCFVQQLVKLRLQFFTLWQIKLVTCHKQLIGYTLQGILHQKFVFSCSQNYANWWIIVRLTYFCFEIVKVEVHLPDVTMLYLCSLQVNQHIAFQDTMVKYQIHLELSASYLHGVLSAHKCKTTSHFQKELLHVVFKSLFQVTLLIAFLFGKSSKFKYEWVANNILRSLYLVPLISQCKNSCLVCA